MTFDVIVRSRKRAPAVVVELEDPRAVKRYVNERMDNLLRTPRADPSPGESYRPRSPPASCLASKRATPKEAMAVSGRSRTSSGRPHISISTLPEDHCE